MSNYPYGKFCCNFCGMQQQSGFCCLPGPQGPVGPPGPPGPVPPARTICVQLPTLFSTQTISFPNTAQLFSIIVTPPGTYVAPFTVQSIASATNASYNGLNFSVAPPAAPGGLSVITMTMEIPVLIRAVDANATPFTISGNAFVPVSVSMVLPPSFNSRDLQALVTLGEASAIITSLTEITLTAEYIICFNAFQPEMVSLQAGLVACACNGVPFILGSI